MGFGAPNRSDRRGGRLKFPKSVRLLRHSDFERVYSQGRRHFAAHMTVFYLRREQGEDLRVGFTVGRALGGAVDRNRMKRRLREVVRLERPVNRFPVDIVINPKKSLLIAEFNEIEKEVARTFSVVQQKIAKGPGSKGRKSDDGPGRVIE